jgi:positive regulator of sigma E activity
MNLDRELCMSSFGLYIIGYIVLIIGLALAANMLGVPSVWIGIGLIIMIGIGILSAVSRTRQRDRTEV